MLDVGSVVNAAAVAVEDVGVAVDDLSQAVDSEVVVGIYVVAVMIRLRA